MQKSISSNYVRWKECKSVFSSFNKKKMWIHCLKVYGNYAITLRFTFAVWKKCRVMQKKKLMDEQVNSVQSIVLSAIQYIVIKSFFRIAIKSRISINFRADTYCHILLFLFLCEFLIYFAILVLFRIKFHCYMTIINFLLIIFRIIWHYYKILFFVAKSDFCHIILSNIFSKILV